MNSDLSFSEFPPITSEEWEERIRQDLGEADYGDTLLWHTEDGITVRPYYRRDDLTGLEHLSDETARPVRVPSSWRIRQDIATPEIGASRSHARYAIAGGVDVLGLVLRTDDEKRGGVPLATRADFAEFASDLPLEQVPIHLDAGRYSPALLALYADYMARRSAEIPAGISTAFDPVGEIARTGRGFGEGLDLAADIIATATTQFPTGRVLQVGAGVFHNAGATIVQETALLLASVVETFTQLIERGVNPRDLIRHIHLAVPVSSSYFFEIARLRALRLTLSQLLDAFFPSQEIAMPPIHSEMSIRNVTLYDPHANLLRATTEAASAVVGGCDVLSVSPFDGVAGRFDEFSYRMARNIHHILRHEAGLARVADAAAGSYYIEVITDAIARRAWQLFRDIEIRGGLIKAVEMGFVQETLRTARTARLRAVAERRRILVGTNHYPVADERRTDDLEIRTDVVDIPPPTNATFSGRFTDIQHRIAIGESIWILTPKSEPPGIGSELPAVREAEQIERIRLRTERSRHVPRILLVPLGDPVVRRARATFARNFLGCGGFDVTTPIGYNSVEAARKAIGEIHPDVVVFCAPNSDYSHIIDEVILEDDAGTAMPLIGLVADREIEQDLRSHRYDFSLDRSSDLVATLEHIQQRLGIRVNGQKEEK